ncbi:MAG: hypothetical protein KF820_07915 [Candidatus Paracaedibacteraceae bacterium]|nr:hypothetical protein [Candidatus Paracaedibacteraceae bacterium]
MPKLILSLLTMISLVFATDMSLSQHAQVMGEIKSRAQKDKDQRLPEIGQITATEYFLSHILAPGYENTIPGMVAAFFDKYPDATITDFEKHQFARMMEAERTFNGWYVFYHAAVGEIGLFYDVISEYRARLAMHHSDDVTVLRALDNKFKDIPSVTEFMKKFEIIQEKAETEASDHGKIDGTKYSELGLSVNPFLFGNLDDEGESSYMFFSKNKSVNPPHIESALNEFLDKIGLNLTWADFEHLTQSYQINSARMFQFFIAPDILDEVGYASGSYGRKFDYEFNGKITHSIKDLLTTLRNKQSQPVNLDLKFLQARLFLKPEIFHDPSKVKVLQYQYNPIPASTMKKYKEELRKMIDKDLDQWLSKQISIDGLLAGNGPNNLQRLHGYINGGDSKLRSQDNFLAQDLYNLLDTDKIDEAIEFVKNHPEIDYKKPRTLDPYIEAQSLAQKVALLPPLSDKKFELIRLMDKDFDQNNAWFWETVLSSEQGTNSEAEKLLDMYTSSKIKLMHNGIDEPLYLFGLSIPDEKKRAYFFVALINYGNLIPKEFNKAVFDDIILIKGATYPSYKLFSQNGGLKDDDGQPIEPYSYGLKIQDDSIKSLFLDALLTELEPIPDGLNKQVLDAAVKGAFGFGTLNLLNTIKDTDGKPIEPYQYALGISDIKNRSSYLVALVKAKIPVPQSLRQEVINTLRQNKRQRIAQQLIDEGTS